MYGQVCLTHPHPFLGCESIMTVLGSDLRGSLVTSVHIDISPQEVAADLSNPDAFL